MKLVWPRSFAASFAVMGAALVLAGVVTTPAAAWGRKKEPPAAAPVAPPPEAELTVGPAVLAGAVIDQASAYATYMRTASGIDHHFANGEAVSSALRIGVHSDDRQLQQGMVAYAAIIALQDQAFTAGLREFAKHASSRDAIIRNILADPNYVLSLKGHESAAGLVVAALNAQGSALASAGGAVQQESLDIQLKAAWSKKPVPNLQGRLTEAKSLATSPLNPADDLRAQLAGAATGASAMPISAAPNPGPYSISVVRGMAIAALAVLGKAGDEDMAYLQPLMANEADAFCFNMSRLNLYQCLSVARPYYEDMYCLGLHAMADKGRCVMTSAGASSKAALPVADAAPARAIPTVASAASPLGADSR
jgi:hypothetical protein